MKNKLIKWLISFLLLSVFLLVLAYALALYIFPDFGMHFFQIDECLDQGGRWNDHISACEFN